MSYIITLLTAHVQILKVLTLINTGIPNPIKKARIPTPIRDCAMILTIYHWENSIELAVCESPRVSFQLSNRSKDTVLCVNDDVMLNEPSTSLMSKL